MKKSAKYKLHRTLAIIAVPVLILSTVTGFFRANQKWFWEDGYKKKKQAVPMASMQEMLPPGIIAGKIDSILGTSQSFEEIILRSEGDAPYYLLTTSKKKKYLAHAVTGEIVSPISEELAQQFAGKYLKEKAAVKSCELIPAYKPRKAKEAKPAYRIEFDNSIHSEVYLDQATGEILEDIDDNRTFGLWVMRMHDYDYFGSKREISSAVGISILLTALSGIWIYRLRLRKPE